MSATPSTINRRSLANAPGLFDRHLTESLVRALRYFERRAAIGRLREFDDRELRDIGLARTQIEAAVHGLLAAPDLVNR